MSNITEDQVLWFPGVYHGRFDEQYGRTVAMVENRELIRIVQARAQEDGEWAIENHLVGDNEDKMRRMMAFVSDEKNILQALSHIYAEDTQMERTVDWLCRELGNASKVMIR